jgi:amidohydrolase
MPVINRIAEFHDEITEWRQDIHAHPELLYEVHRTAALVAEKLREFGVDEVVSEIGRTGVVGIIKGRSTNSGKTIGLRADMDALPILEKSDADHVSTVQGVMHACGHDGHTAMLLGAAKYLSETRNFDGNVVVIFQPAEEGGAGAKAMIDDGLMTRWNIDEVYGMHNSPGLDVGKFAIRSGTVMAATDEFNIVIEGNGGHAARPYESTDPILIGTQIYQALQSIISRNVDPLESAVLSVTAFNAGEAFNVIPQRALMRGTVRTLQPEIRDLVEKRMTQLVTSIAELHGATIDLDYDRGYPMTINDVEKTAVAASIAKNIVGDVNVNTERPPTMGGEDFSFMLEKRPGAMIFIGNGDTAKLHNEEYDFNDEIIPVGCSYWAKLVESTMPTGG